MIDIHALSLFIIIDRYSLYFEMKNKNISFAQVLKKKGRSSQLELQKVNLRLVEMVQQWEVYPD
jgi:hypothetical protein